MKQFYIHNRPFTFSGDSRTRYFCVDTLCDPDLNVREVSYVRLTADGRLPPDWRSRVRTTRALDTVVPPVPGGFLGGAYNPASDMPTLDTVIPDNFDGPMDDARAGLRSAVGDVDGFVCARLRMGHDELRGALKAEQVDGVALAIYNIEARRQGLIIGDQTGIGKGRQAAAVIRYALVNGLTPVFVSAGAFLFSDMYRDCRALGIGKGGSPAVNPMVFNSGADVFDFGQRAGEVDYARADGETDSEYERRILREQRRLYPAVFKPAAPGDFAKPGLADGRNCVFATYSQFQGGGDSDKKAWLTRYAQGHDCVFILDEAHKAAGASNTGAFFRDILRHARGCVFLSATFAKDADSLAFFAQRTLLSESFIRPDDLARALGLAGNAVMEYVSRELVRCGQMIRRERRTKGVGFESVLPAPAQRDSMRRKVDEVVGVLQDMMRWHSEVSSKHLRDLTSAEAARFRYGSHALEVRFDSPADSLFLVSEALLLAAKADIVAERAAEHVRKGRKVVIALSKTSESLLTGDGGDPLPEGQAVDGDFTARLTRIARRLPRVTFTLSPLRRSAQGGDFSADGYTPGKNGVWSKVVPLTGEALAGLEEIMDRLRGMRTGLPASPIDAIVGRLRRLGIEAAELTGRKRGLAYGGEGFKEARVAALPRRDVGMTVKAFQDNELDVLIINSSAATGVSCHAVPTDKVPAERVKQRYMILAQPELDVNVEVQKMGRIDRTGQLPTLPPQYEYVMTGIPVEDRMQMMTRTKMQGLFSATSSDQHAIDSAAECPDFYNKYGDMCVKQWLRTHHEQASMLGIGSDRDIDGIRGSAARVVSGRMAMLTCDEQERFYAQVQESYTRFARELKEDGKWDLDIDKYDIRADFKPDPQPVITNCGGSAFGGNLGSGRLVWQERHKMTFERLVSEAESLRGENRAAHAALLREIERVEGEGFYHNTINTWLVRKIIKAVDSHGFIVCRRRRLGRTYAILGLRLAYSRTTYGNEAPYVAYIIAKTDKAQIIRTRNVIEGNAVERLFDDRHNNSSKDDSVVPSEAIAGSDPEAREFWGDHSDFNVRVLSGNLLSVYTGKLNKNESRPTIFSCTLKDGSSALFAKYGGLWSDVNTREYRSCIIPLSSGVIDFLNGEDDARAGIRGNTFPVGAVTILWQAGAAGVILYCAEDGRMTINAPADEDFARLVSECVGRGIPADDKTVSLTVGDLDRLGQRGCMLRVAQYRGMTKYVREDRLDEHLRHVARGRLWPTLGWDEVDIPANSEPGGASLIPNPAQKPPARRPSAEAEAALDRLYSAVLDRLTAGLI